MGKVQLCLRYSCANRFSGFEIISPTLGYECVPVANVRGISLYQELIGFGRVRESSVLLGQQAGYNQGVQKQAQSRRSDTNGSGDLVSGHRTSLQGRKYVKLHTRQHGESCIGSRSQLVHRVRSRNWPFHSGTSQVYFYEGKFERAQG